MAVGSFVWALLLGAGPGPSSVLFDVGLVRVSPTRPGTNTPWDPVAEKQQADGFCGLFTLGGEAYGYLHLGSLGATAGGAAGGEAEKLCHKFIGAAEASKAPVPTDPDLFVRVVASREVGYRSYTAHDTTSHVFHFRVAVPFDAIPNSGVQIYVQNDRGSGSDDSREVIGSVRVHRKELLAALNGDGLLRLDDKSGGLDRIEIEVSNPELPKAFEARGDLSKFALFRLEGLDFPAGIVAEIGESGTYQLGQLGSFTPVGRGVGPSNFQDPAFRTAPHGAGIAVVGEGGHLAGYVVGPCRRFVVTTPGAVLVGVNSTGLRSGSITMEVRSRLATAEEWRTGKATGKCEAPKEPALDAAAPEDPSRPAEGAAPNGPGREAWSGPLVASVQQLVQTNGSNIALAIQGILHPTGIGAALQAFDYGLGSEGVSFRFATSWRGALGARHVTTVVWEVGPQGHRRAAVLSDTARIRTGRRNIEELNRYFATKLYPQIAPSAGPAN